MNPEQEIAEAFAGFRQLAQAERHWDEDAAMLAAMLSRLAEGVEEALRVVSRQISELPGAAVDD